MNFDFSDDAKTMRESARKFLDANAGPTVARKSMNGDAAFDADLWKQVVELGWTAARVPEEFGGQGGDHPAGVLGRAAAGRVRGGGTARSARNRVVGRRHRQVGATYLDTDCFEAGEIGPGFEIMVDDQPAKLLSLEVVLEEGELTENGVTEARDLMSRLGIQPSELIDGALGDDAMVLERTIDVHIRSLRQKLGKHADVIETVRGVGYRFREPNFSTP